MGWSSILIPGSGEPNFDTWVANPFETSKQTREKEIHSLLGKLPPETIMLDPSKIGTLRPNRRKEMEAEKEVAVEAVKEIALKKKKTKGRNKTSKRVMKRKVMVDKAKKRKHREETELPPSLKRFIVSML
ncbi:U3 small nucleolar RNA-associated protein 7 [Linum perenne]